MNEQISMEEMARYRTKPTTQNGRQERSYLEVWTMKQSSKVRIDDTRSPAHKIFINS